MIGDTVKTAYSGYANNKAASEKKIIYDVFKKGQKAFNSGLKIVLFCFLLKNSNNLKLSLFLFITTHSFPYVRKFGKFLNLYF
jgi:hypothetical protein